MKFDHITLVLRELRWLPVRKRIVYKPAVMIYKCLHGMAPLYLAADCAPVTSIVSRQHSRSAVSGRLTVTATTWDAKLCGGRWGQDLEQCAG